MGTFIASLGNFSAVPVAPSMYRPGVIGGFAITPGPVQSFGEDLSANFVLEILGGGSPVVFVGGGCAVVGPPGGQWLLQWQPWPLGSADSQGTGISGTGVPGYDTGIAVPANAQSWLWLTVTVTGGVPSFSFYFNSSSTTPTNVGDALIGWVVSGVDPARSIQVIRAWSQNLVWAAFGAGKGTVTFLPTAPAPLPAGPGSGTGGPLTLVFNGSVAQFGQPYNGSLAATGGTEPYTYALASGSSLPPGLSLDPTTGAITGTPTQEGAFAFTGQVTDSSPLTVTVACTIFVVNTGALSITFGPGSAIIGTEYSGALAGHGGDTPYTYSIVSGALPPGLSLSSSTGQISGVPTALGSFGFTGQVTDASGNTAQIIANLVVSAVGASAPVGEVTGLSVTARYFTAADGNTADEAWQLVTSATAPSDKKWGSSRVFLLPFTVLAAPGPAMSVSGYTNPTGSQGIGATTSGFAGGNIDIYVTPWSVPSQVTVGSDGVTLTWTAGPKFNVGLSSTASGAAGPTGFVACLVAGVLNRVQITSSTSATLSTAVTPASGVTLATMEARFGLMQDSTVNTPNGDTIIMDVGTANQEAFRIISLSGVLQFGTGDWLAKWTVFRSPGAHPAHNGATAPVTYGGAAYTTFLIDVDGAGADLWAGVLNPPQTGTAVSSVSAAYQVGAPTSYIVFAVGQTAAFQLNPWPTTTTPVAVLGTAEYQNETGLQAARLVPTQINEIIQTTVGNTGNLLTDPGYELQGDLESEAWVGAANPGAFSGISNPGIGPHSGLWCWKLNSPSSGVFANVSQILNTLQQGESYKVSVWAASASAASSLGISVDCFSGPDGTGSPVGSPFSVGSVPGNPGATPSWAQYTFTFTVPAGTASIQIFAGIGNSGNWFLDDWTLTPLQSVSGSSAISYDANGDLVVNVAGIGGGVIISGGQIQIAPNSLNIAYFAPGSAPTQYGAFTTRTQSGAGGGAVTSGSNALSLAGSVSSVASGWYVTGPGVPPGTVVSSIVGAAVTLSQNANATSAGGTYTFVNLPAIGSSYPAGSFLFNTNNGRMYQAKTGSFAGTQWVDVGDPGDMVAGVLAAGIVVAGAAVFGTLTAVSVVDSTFTTTGGGITVSIDSTNYVLVSGGSTNQAQLTNSQLDISGSSSTATVNDGGISVTVLGTLSMVLTPSELLISSLPSSSPGAGSKQFWYDPSDSNRVKYAP